MWNEPRPTEITLSICSGIHLTAFSVDSGFRNSDLAAYGVSRSVAKSAGRGPAHHWQFNDFTDAICANGLAILLIDSRPFSGSPGLEDGGFSPVGGMRSPVHYAAAVAASRVLTPIGFLASSNNPSASL